MFTMMLANAAKRAASTLPNAYFRQAAACGAAEKILTTGSWTKNGSSVSLMVPSRMFGHSADGSESVGGVTSGGGAIGSSVVAESSYSAKGENPGTISDVAPSTDDAAVDEDEELEQEEMFVEPHPSLGHTMVEWGGPTRGGRLAEPTRFGDWERKGRCTDF